MLFRSILLARKGDVRVSVVLGKSDEGDRDWQYCSCVEDVRGGGKDKFKFETFFEVFGSEDRDARENMRFYTRGIPDVFEDMGVDELLEW